MITALFLTQLFFAQPAAAASVTTPLTTSLEGTYVRPCYVVDTDALTNELSIQGNQWKLQHLAYEDEKCELAYLIYEVDYKVSSENTHDIDMTTTEVSYTTLSDEVTRALNMIHYCGFEDWQTKTKKIVTGKLCDEFHAPALGSMIYSIYNLNQNANTKELYLGTSSETGDGKTAESRHDQVDSLPLFKLK